MSSVALGRGEACLKGLEDSDVRPYLERYGYRAAGLQAWDSAESFEDLPELEIKVAGHGEIEKHTMYYVDCSLRSPSFPSAPLKWRALRRLQHLREGLHDRLKKETDPQVFKKLSLSTFAPRGGMPGTTAALNNWCCNLAAGINKRDVSPRLVAVALHFLEAPQLAPEILVGRSTGTSATQVDGRVQFAPPHRHEVSVGSIDSETLAFDEFLEGQCAQQGSNIGTVDIDFVDELDVDLETELESMKLSSLQRRAAAAGATAAELRAARDEDDPKTALVDLIHSKQRGPSDKLPSDVLVHAAPAPRSVSRVPVSDSDDDAPKERIISAGDIARTSSDRSDRTAELDTDVPTWKLLEEEEAAIQRREIERRAKEEADLAAASLAKEEVEGLGLEAAIETEQERLAGELLANAEAGTFSVENVAKEESDSVAVKKEQDRLLAEDAAKIEADEAALELAAKTEADRIAQETVMAAAVAKAKEEADMLAESGRQTFVEEKAAKDEGDQVAPELPANAEAETTEQEGPRAEAAAIAKEEAYKLAEEEEGEEERKLLVADEAERLEQEKLEAEAVSKAEQEEEEEIDRFAEEGNRTNIIEEDIAKIGIDQSASDMATKVEAERLEQETLEAETANLEAKALIAENAAKEEILASELAAASDENESNRLEEERLAAQAAANAEAERLISEQAAMEEASRPPTEAPAESEALPQSSSTDGAEEF